MCRIAVEMTIADHRAIDKATLRRTLISICRHLTEALRLLSEIAADNGIELDEDWS